MEIEQKLQLTRHHRLDIVNGPSGFAIVADDSRVAGSDDALLVFVRDESDLRHHLAAIVASARVDHMTWVAYPKGRQLGTDLNRDRLANELTQHGIRPVRQVSIDAVWSALRCRSA